MKITYSMISILMALCLFSGCASMGTGRDLTGYGPIGIISVVSNSDINWQGEGPSSKDGGPLGAIFSRRKDEAMTRVSNAVDLINDAEAILRDTITYNHIADLVPPSRITGSQTYQEAAINRQQEQEGAIHADGYRLVYYRDKAFAKNLAQETGVQSGMYVTFNFTKTMFSGIGKNGTLKAKVSMNVLIITADGKTIYNRTREFSSDDSITVSSGYYYHEDLMDLFQSVIGEACYRFALEFMPTR